jgi:hypothetical protein
MTLQPIECIGQGAAAPLNDAGDGDPGLVVGDPAGDAAEEREGADRPFQEGLGAFARERTAEQRAGDRPGHDEERGLGRLAADDQLGVAEVGLGLLRAGLDGDEDLGVSLSVGADGIADDARAAPVAELASESMIDPRGGVPLPGGCRSIGLEDLMDRLQEGSEFGFDARIRLPVSRRLFAGQDLLESGPMEIVFPAGRALREPVHQHTPPDLSPVVHVVVHRSTS